MGKLVKRISYSVIVVASIIIILNLYAKYGWKLFGFKYCENPNPIWVHSIDVLDNKVHLKGDTSDSAPSFVGYTYKINDDKLYIGMKYNVILGFTKRLGAFDITLNCETSNINSIVLIGRSREEIIWKR